MSFAKNGEVKVYKKGQKIGPKFASEDESNRFTVDDLVEESNNCDSKISFVELDKQKEEDVSD